MSKAKINKLIKFIKAAPADQEVKHTHAYRFCAVGHYANSIGEQPNETGSMLSLRGREKGGYKGEVMSLLSGRDSGITMGEVAKSVQRILDNHGVQL